MIDVKQCLTALKLKRSFKIFNENFVADWKTIENIFLKKNLLFCVVGIYDFYELTKPSSELFSRDKIAITFGMKPNK